MEHYFSVADLKIIYDYMASIIAVPHKEGDKAKPPYSTLKKVEALIAIKEETDRKLD